MVSCFSTGNTSDVSAIIDVGYTDHQGLGDSLMYGPDGFSQVVNAARLPYRKLSVEVVELRSGAESAEARLRWYGVRHNGATVERETIEVIRAVNGRVVEHWGRRA